MEAGAEQLPIDQTKAFTGALFLLLRGPAIELATYTPHFDSLSSHHILSPPALRGGFFSGAIKVACGFAGRATRSTLRVRTGQCG